MTKEELAELHDTFNYFDGDHNGHIDRAEFAKLLDALGAGGTREETDIGFEIIDSDQNGTIEFREFVKWWKDR